MNRALESLNARILGNEHSSPSPNFKVLPFRNGRPLVDDAACWAIDVSAKVPELGTNIEMELRFVELRTLMVATDWENLKAMEILAITDARWFSREDVREALTLADYKKSQKTAASKVEQMCMGVEKSRSIAADFNVERGELAPIFVPGPFAKPSTLFPLGLSQIKMHSKWC